MTELEVTLLVWAITASGLFILAMLEWWEEVRNHEATVRKYKDRVEQVEEWMNEQWMNEH